MKKHGSEETMSKPVHKAGVQSEFWIRERCYIREIVNTPAIRDFSLAESRVEPGVTTELHSLLVKEWYVILSGKGKVEVEQHALDVDPGDIVEIPAGSAQRITNTSDTDLVFQCICLPRFTPDSYQPLE